MLRPAFLLRLWRPSSLALSMSSFVGRDLSRRRRPATGLSGDYPDGTDSRCRHAAWRSTSSPPSASNACSFTTHHQRTIAPRSLRPVLLHDLRDAFDELRLVVPFPVL